MLYKDFLVREGNPLNEEREKAHREKRKKMQKTTEPPSEHPVSLESRIDYLFWKISRTGFFEGFDLVGGF